MHPRQIAVALLLGAALGCGDDKPKPDREIADVMDVMPQLPLPPGGKFISRGGSKDALRLTLRSDIEPERVLVYYRDVFTRGDWRLVSDQKDRDGVTVLYAERAGPSLWVRVWPEPGSGGSMIQMIGASDAARKRDSAPTESKPAAAKPEA